MLSRGHPPDVPTAREAWNTYTSRVLPEHPSSKHCNLRPHLPCTNGFDLCGGDETGSGADSGPFDRLQRIAHGLGVVVVLLGV
jgi:hypothetical protein